jgi:hypothetical protein
VLIGCGASVTRVAVSGGRDGLLIDCSAAPANVCQFEAESQCPNGYQVVASKRDQLTIVCRSSPPSEGTVAAPSTTPVPTSSPGGSEALGMVYGFSFGGGRIEMTENQEPPPPSEGSGWGFAGDVLVAKQLLPWFALGGAFSFQQLNTLKVDLYETQNAITLGFLGPDLEALICSMHCVRFGGAFGVAILSAPQLSDVKNTIRRWGTRPDTSVMPSDSNNASVGLGYNVHLAFDLKVAPKWYAGFGFRVIGIGISSERSVIGYSMLLDVLNR